MFPAPSKHRRYRTSLFGTALALCVAGGFSGSFSGATPADSAPRPLKVLGHDGNSMEYLVYPEARGVMLFPGAEALLDEQQDLETWNLRPAPILKKIHILRIADPAHRFTVSAAAVGDQLFIFDSLFCSENSAAMTELMRASHSAPSNASEALNLVKLYLALSYYQADDPKTFVAIRTGKPKLQNDAEGPKTFSDLVGVAHSPQVVRMPNGYSVDLYTRKLSVTGGAAIHWKIELTPTRFDEQMSSGTGTEPWIPKDEAEKNGGNKKITFHVGMMGDGSTDDGAKTDIQNWFASDGPGVSRIHYYYKSADKAEKRMEDSTQNALAVLQNSPWTSDDGMLSGKELLVIRINENHKSLYASHLYLYQASVVELSCGCLRNILDGHSINDFKNRN
jgi:hypothetical protein